MCASESVCVCVRVCVNTVVSCSFFHVFCFSLDPEHLCESFCRCSSCCAACVIVIICQLLFIYISLSFYHIVIVLLNQVFSLTIEV